MHSLRYYRTTSVCTFLRASRGTFLLQTAATVGYNRILSLFTKRGNYQKFPVSKLVVLEDTEKYNLSEAPTGVPHRYVDVPSEEAGGSARREELAHTLSTA